MSQAVSPSNGKRYSLARVCRVWEIPRSALYFQRCRPEPMSGPRGPVGPLTDGEMVEQIHTVLGESPFHGEGYQNVWVRWRFKGIRTSRRRVL